MHPAAVLVHYKHRELTRRCLGSLLEHCPTLTAIYIVGNSGAADLAELAAEFLDARLHWLPQPENLGFGIGCNRGIEAALTDGADAVMLINNDAWVEADIVAAFVAADRRYHGKALLTGEIYTPEGLIWYAGGDYSLATARTRHWQAPLAREKRVPFACGCLMWLPKSLLAKVPGFAQDYFLYLEDLDLCLAARREGFAIVCLPEVRIRHQPSSSTGGRESPLAVYYQNRNRWLLLRRYGRMRHWAAFLPFYAIGFVKRLFSPQAAASRAALFDALRAKWGPRQR